MYESLVDWAEDAAAEDKPESLLSTAKNLWWSRFLNPKDSERDIKLQGYPDSGVTFKIFIRHFFMRVKTNSLM